MLTTAVAVPHLTDAELLIAVTRAAAEERSAAVKLIGLLAELDGRRLYLSEGCSSLFTYCTRVLHLSEHAAYGRIQAARCARQYPMILDLLEEGAITLTTIGLLSPHLTSDNADDLLSAARHRTKREVEQLVAALRPLPPVPSSVRRLPALAAAPAPAAHQGLMNAASASAPSAGARAAERPADAREASANPTTSERNATRRVDPPIVTALAPERYRVQFTISATTHDLLRRAQELLRHVVSNGDPAAIVDRALRLLVADLERTRLAATSRPRPPRIARTGSRHIPAAIRRQVWARDRGQCTFIGTQGRCTERGFIEVHHIVPSADGGRTVIENLALRCRGHNLHEAEAWFGPWRVREAVAVYGTMHPAGLTSPGARLGSERGNSSSPRFHAAPIARYFIYCNVRRPPDAARHPQRWRLAWRITCGASRKSWACSISECG